MNKNKNIVNVNVFRLQHRRKLTFKGKIAIFKSLAISKIVCSALLTMIPNPIIEELKQIQKKFLWGNKKPKIKHDTLSKKYKDDKVHKVVSLKYSWVRRLCNENFHEWKFIPLHYIKKVLRQRI